MPGYVRRVVCHVSCSSQERDSLQDYLEEELRDRGFADYENIYYNSDDMVEVDGELVPVEMTTSCRCCDTLMLDHERISGSNLYANASDDDREVLTTLRDVCSVGCAQSLGYVRIVGAIRSGETGYIHPVDYGLLSYCAENPHLSDTCDDHPYLVGLEVEKEDSELSDSTLEEALEHGWIAVRDGSLGSYGSEFVSPAYNLTRVDGDWGRRALNRALENMDQLDWETSELCGGHITVSRRSTPGSELLASLRDFVPLLFSLYPRRLRGEYSEPRTYNDTLAGSCKFRAINLKRDRIEFRIFPGVRDSEQLDWRVRLIDLAIRLCNEGTFVSSLGDDDSDLCKLLSERVECVPSTRARYRSFRNYWLVGESDDIVERYINA